MNTEINYFYRDEDNFKNYFRVVVAGELTSAQEEEITDLMPDGEFFPSDVGLDENVSCEWWGAEYVDQKPTINMTADELVARFHEAHEGKKPYSVTIKEVSSRTVIVWAESRIDAEQKAEDLCNDSTIILDADDFDERECHSDGIVPEADFGYFTVFGGK